MGKVPVPPLLRIPTPAPYFHTVFNFSDFPTPGEAIKIYFLPFKNRKGGRGVGGGVSRVRTMLTGWPINHSSILDNIGIFQKYQATGNAFEQIATEMLESIIGKVKSAQRTNVFDTYKEQSIKNADRIRRSSSKIPFIFVYFYDRFVAYPTDVWQLLRLVHQQRNIYYLSKVVLRLWWSRVGYCRRVTI